MSIRRRLGRLPRRTTAGVLAGVAALSTIVATIGFGAASARDDDLIGEPVSAEQFAAIAAAAQSCPMLTPARVAGQLMAESGLDAAAAVTTSGGQGIAGLDERDWQEWAPWPAARRTDLAANVIALARQMCQLGGKLRVAEVPGDRWRLALAAFHTGLDSVTVAGGEPDQALGYIGAASGYAAYYSQLPQFAGAGEAPADPARQPKAIPEGYVDLIVAAGSVCAPVTAPAIAAQLMALSGFDATATGEDGRAGIAQFRPQLWEQYGPDDATAYVPAAAIPALGAAMCALVAEFADVDGGDPYELALAAYHRGVDAVRDADEPLGKQTEDLVAAVRRLTDFYAMDGRMVSPSTSPSPSVSPSVTASPRTPAADPTRPGPGATTPPAKVVTPPAAAPPPDTRATNNTPPQQTTPAAPPAPVRPSNMRQLVGKETGLCVSAGAGSDGTQLTLQRCAENKSQWWEIRSDGTIRANGLCMDVAWGASADGTAVQVAYCSGNPAQNWQKWQGRSGTLVNPLTGKCLDVAGHGVGAPLMIWHCVGHPKQTFDAR
ncbi:ricin-type beta-trefoil lectin domain protein [Solwaraspora sp. WMMA2101]|uniref:ricin-type beta-trefoil lectin domain protein n=1 Tax=Solwaraspora sp. WMMA2101 TaxID=3404124 RepID=UPI003B94610B